MLDIKFIREHTDIVRENLAKRRDNEKIEWLNDLISKDIEYRKLLNEAQRLRAKRNTITDEINKLKKEGKDASDKLAEAKLIPSQIKEIEAEAEKILEKIKFYQMRIPNIMHESVPFGKDSSENVEIKRWGEIKKKDFELVTHGDLISSLGVADFERATKVAGAGFYYLKGDLALLDFALQMFAVEMLVKRGYSPVSPPLMMNKAAYEGVTDLSDFEKVMYKIDGEDLYLIATSEHPIGAMFMNEIFDEKDLPIKYCGISPCFRKEIGSHGVDTRGLFRVHQFNKIEQFVFCKPEDSWKFHEELLENAEKIFQALDIPYRVVNICTGDLGIVAAKKYDIEAWFPRQNKFCEVVSCSNCTSYQAVRLNIKYRKGNEKEYVHTLNSTAVATSRALVAIIENYQNKDGTISVPKVLIPYMHGIDLIKPAKR